MLIFKLLNYGIGLKTIVYSIISLTKLFQESKGENFWYHKIDSFCAYILFFVLGVLLFFQILDFERIIESINYMI